MNSAAAAFVLYSHMSFSFATIQQYHQQLLSGATTCTRAVTHYLQNIQANSHLNAMVHVFEQDALSQAQKLDLLVAEGKPLLPLHGVVVSIKDVFNYQGKPVSAASNMLKGYTALYNATAVERILQAGAIIIGTTNCDEFAMGSTNENSAHGPVLNAADNTKVPGGSSGGAAVSVQASLCMVALGSDTGGSVRQPADFCGVFGLKPSYGRISRFGLIAYASSFDCVGIFGNSTADVATVYNIVAGADGKDSTAMAQAPEPIHLSTTENTKKYRFAWLAPTLVETSPDAEIQAAIKSTFSALEAQGHTVTSLPFDLFDFIVPAYYVLTTAEASSNLGRFDGIRYGHAEDTPPADLTAFYKRNRSQGFGKEVQRRIMLGSFVLSAGYFDAYFTKAQQVRQSIINETTSIFKGFDAIIMPVSPNTAPVLGESEKDPIATYLADIYTVFANLAGVPAMAIPLYKHSNGMPFGVQVLTNRGEEVLLHSISGMLEKNFKQVV
ncbi:MAG TPA: Asp-tRNA(Asn)/Glu-tRNA(Gln) amidotransferase subunit GatA [Phnomibacter sp.]|nr:Asp-tRNA(Asn)/Glu-tRNA(Gln) amidotransferase subunit GatA [Phnomibacter sp.]